MTTAHLDIDLDGPDVNVTVDMPSIDFGVPGLTGPRGATGHDIVFVVFGPVSVRTGTVGFYPRVNGEITRVTAALSNQLSGTTRPDVNINGVSIFTTQANRPLLASVGRHFDDAGVIEAGTFTDTDYITCDVDAVGTGATDLIVTVEYTS